MVDLIIIFLLASIGGYIGVKLKIPAGDMLGALFVTAIFGVFVNKISFPVEFKFLVQIATGILIGSRIKQKDLKDMKKIIKPILLIITSMIIINFIMVIVIYKLTDMDLVTALFATSPGGLTDMTILAYEFGADISKVALLQLVRLLSIIIFIPSYVKFLIKRNKIKGTLNNSNLIVESKIKNSKKEILMIMIVGVISGIFGIFSKIPAGGLTCGMIGAAIYNVKIKEVAIPGKLKRLVKIIAGILIGGRINYSDIISLNTIIFPMLIIIFGFLLMNIILGKIIYKVTDFNMQTSYFSTAPGGMSDIAIISDEVGADTPKVALIQLARFLCIVGLYPFIISIILNNLK